LQQQFESLVKEFGDSAHKSGVPQEEVQAGSTSESGEPSFQDSIRKTMQRMQESGEQASAAAVSDNPDDILAELLKHMQAGDLEGGGDESFSKLLLGMMEQLTNKEILYEPMKELHDKFPEWLEKNKATTSAEDLARYHEQQAIVSEIVTKFEESTYSDDNAKDREYIVDRMQKVRYSIWIKLETNKTTDASCWLSASRSCGRYECGTRRFR
jgi:peroxin-19